MHMIHTSPRHDTGQAVLGGSPIWHESKNFVSTEMHTHASTRGSYNNSSYHSLDIIILWFTYVTLPTETITPPAFQHSPPPASVPTASLPCAHNIGRKPVQNQVRVHVIPEWCNGCTMMCNHQLCRHSSPEQQNQRIDTVNVNATTLSFRGNAPRGVNQLPAAAHGYKSQQRRH